MENHPDQFRSLVCVTAQHREMLDQVLRIFDIQPDHDLNIMKPKQDLFGITSEVLLKLRDLLREIQPDLILVQGDTTTTFAASLAAFYQKIRIGHVEAGLGRTINTDLFQKRSIGTSPLLWLIIILLLLRGPNSIY